MARLGPTGLVQLITDIKTWVLTKLNGATVAKARGLPTGTVNETTATTTLTITLDGITELYAGLAICIRMPFNNSASSTLNVNNLGAKPIYYQNNTTSKDMILANAYAMLVYDTTTTSTGCWKILYSKDNNTDTLVGQNISTTNNTYPVLLGATANATANIGNKSTIFGKDIKVNPSTGALYATKLYSGGTEVLTAHQSLTNYATKTYVDTAVSDLVNSAPEALDTLKELADALGNDANFATSMATSIGEKADDSAVVHNTGDETIAGTKTFSSTISGSISGNAGTATQFSANTTVALTGDATGTSAGSKKGWSVPVTLANSGVTAGSYGPATAVSPAHGGTFSVPYMTVDAKGRVTAASSITITLPADSNTDTLMTQNVSTTNSTYPVLLCATANATTNQGAKTGIFAKGVKINPSTNVVTASGFAGPLTGDVTGNCSGSSGSCTGLAAKATADASGNTITSTYATITDTAEMTAAEVTAISSTILT